MVAVVKQRTTYQMRMAYGWRRLGLLSHKHRGKFDNRDERSCERRVSTRSARWPRLASPNPSTAGHYSILGKSRLPEPLASFLASTDGIDQ